MRWASRMAWRASRWWGRVSLGGMEVHVTRSGGFAGLRAEATIDTSVLAEPARSAIEQLVAAAAPAAGSVPPPRGADRFQYTLSAADGPAHPLDEGVLPAEAIDAIHGAFAAKP